MITRKAPDGSLESESVKKQKADPPANTLFYGDNLARLQKMKGHSVDLIYLDPPFNSKQTYNLIYKTMTGKPVPEQAEAFFDAWEMDAEKQKIARSIPELMREQGVEDQYIHFWRLWIDSLKGAKAPLLAYLVYMVHRLIYMRPILRDTGSIYLHCDPTASHYIKVMMDGIFGHENFRNEIIWKRTSAHSSARRYGPVHDVIFFYSKTERYTWNKSFTAYGDDYVRDRFKRGEERPWKDADLTGSGTRNGETGQVWRGFDVTAKGRHWAYPPSVLDQMDIEGRIYWPKKHGGWPREKKWLDQTKGIPLQDVWTDISPVNSQATDRLGYPTQKPVELMKRIILASSNPGDVVFDPFCGCGTSIYAAHETGRRWLGCDIAILAVRIIREVLAERYRLAEGTHYAVDGIPLSVDAALELAQKDKFQFQHWAVERTGGFPMRKKVADQGIDGRLYFEAGGGLKSMVVSVKAGSTGPEHIRELRGVLEREADAALAGFICLHDATKGMRTEAAAAGMYSYKGVDYPRVQILTIADILVGKREFLTPGKIGSRISTGQGLLPDLT